MRTDPPTPAQGPFARDRTAAASGLELTWPGKYAADGTRTRPSRGFEPLEVAERFPASTGTTPNLVVAGDNLRALPALLADFAGRVDLVYLDPPFGTGEAFRLKATRSAGAAPDGDAAGPGHSPRSASVPGPAAYADRRPGGVGGFIAMLAPRLELIRELLAPTGSLYLHLDSRTVHAAKLLCDEIFGASSFRNHLVWTYAGRELARRRYNAKHDDILFYTRGRTWCFHPERILEPLRESSRRALTRHVADDGIPYVIRYREGGGFAGRDEPGRTYRQRVPDGTLPRDWFSADYARKSQRTGYPTQKPESLLARLIAASSEPGDLVVDLFAGSGTTAAASAALGRRWLVGDASPAAIAATRRRLLTLPDRAGGFAVAALAGALPATVAADLVIRTAGDPTPDAPGLVRISGPAEDLEAVGAWAVGAREGSAGAFVAAGTAARDPWTGKLAAEIPLRLRAAPAGTNATGLADPGLMGRAWTAAGVAIDVPVLPEPPGAGR